MRNKLMDLKWYTISDMERPNNNLYDNIESLSEVDKVDVINDGENEVITNSLLILEIGDADNDSQSIQISYKSDSKVKIFIKDRNGSIKYFYSLRASPTFRTLIINLRSFKELKSGTYAHGLYSSSINSLIFVCSKDKYKISISSIEVKKKYFFSQQYSDEDYKFEKSRVSCIMLTYNRLDYFRKSLKSFIKQTYEDKELIIVNNGDKEYIKKIDDELKKYMSYNIRHIKAKKSTMGSLRNIGLSNCSGEYVMTYDDDDEHHPDRISYSVKEIVKNKVDGLLFKNIFVLSDEKYYLCKFSYYGIEPTLIHRRRYGVRYRPIELGEDTEYIKDLRNNNTRIIVVDNPPILYKYVWHNNNIISNGIKNGIIRNNADVVYTKEYVANLENKYSNSDNNQNDLISLGVSKNAKF